MNHKKKRPAKIELDGGQGELVIAWKGGGESRYFLVDLRKNCPCAMCRDQRGQDDVQEGELTLLEGEAATATAQPRRGATPLTTKRSQRPKEAAAASNHQVRGLVRIGLGETDQASLNG